MRILTIAKSLGPGGAERVAQNCALGYRQAGHDSALLAYAGGGPREQTLREANIPVFVVDSEGSNLDTTLKRAVSWKPTVIHLHRMHPQTRTTNILKYIKRYGETRLPVVERNIFGKPDYTESRHLIDIHQQLTKWSYWKWRQWTKSLNPRPVGTVVPNATDTNTFYSLEDTDHISLRKRFDIPTDAFLFGCFAQPTDIKWPPITFNAFAEIARTYSDVYFVAAGLTESAHNYYNAKFPDIRNRLIRLSFINDDDLLRRCYNMIDVFLHASRIGESFGLVFVESLLCGTPVITLSTPARGNSQLEIVGHKRGGLIANNKKGMIEAMKRLLEDDEMRKRLGRTGSRFVRKQYTFDYVIPKLLKLLDIAIRCRDQESLREALENDPELITDVPIEEIETLMTNSIGTVSTLQRMLMRFVHQPWIYRRWYKPPA